MLNKIVSVLCVFVLAIASQGRCKERCVPDTNGEWRCGSDITSADAAPLPKPTQSNAPPVLLIDPRRFGEMDRAPSIRSAPGSKDDVQASDAAPTNNETPRRPQDMPSKGKAYTVQLALATNPIGFDTLVRKLAITPAQTRRLKLANGMWALLYGAFDTIEQARSNIPKGATGAFARANFSEQ
jgi:hypothetical protein